MKKNRQIGFTIAILLGIAGGMAYGWMYYPTEITTTALEDLRSDYKTDYVLMVAEVYTSDGDLTNAMELLKKINLDDPLRAVQEGLLTAQKMGYEDWEMRYMADLELGIRNQLAQGAAE